MFNKRRFITRSGFTVIEILVSLAVLSIIFAIIFVGIVNLTGHYYTQGALNELNNNGSLALDELAKELRESKMSTVRIIEDIRDDATNQYHDLIIFASGRGPYNTDPALDESFFHIHQPGNFDESAEPDNLGKPMWLSAVVYYPFTTASGASQLCRYVYYCPDNALTPNVREHWEDNFFPLNATVTQTNINLLDKFGNLLTSFDRANGAERISAYELSTEDGDNDNILDSNEDDDDESETTRQLPKDNADGTLDTGINYSRINNNNTVAVKLFLQKPVALTTGVVKRRIAVTLAGAVTPRN